MAERDPGSNMGELTRCTPESRLRTATPDPTEGATHKSRHLRPSRRLASPGRYENGRHYPARPYVRILPDPIMKRYGFDA